MKCVSAKLFLFKPMRYLSRHMSKARKHSRKISSWLAYFKITTLRKSFDWRELVFEMSLRPTLSANPSLAKKTKYRLATRLSLLPLFPYPSSEH
ncbi:hypothetical protein CDAR_605081 [Caerostris darwini]|uniref:Uncharacterized protein n=1 Tax=Caerostris darwini TaxID=1538125 RepID=A0AAV4X7L5_9ARAC|nr:hypothetical protein CDAR_605081 [Caerostris darwini]